MPRFKFINSMLIVDYRHLDLDWINQLIKFIRIPMGPIVRSKFILNETIVNAQLVQTLINCKYADNGYDHGKCW